MFLLNILRNSLAFSYSLNFGISNLPTDVSIDKVNSLSSVYTTGDSIESAI